ncbi:MAG: hypothetical protein IKX56_04015 [Muribaculaceae bacterium]|nr:hypothetical protein [Muribaculaceae bacterium]
MKPRSLKLLCSALLLAVFVVMYLLNRFSPMSCDDWHYVFIFGTLEPIDSLSDIMVSQWNHYLRFNGRLVIHFIVQLFDGLLGKGTFNVFNALMFVLFLCGIARLVTNDKRNHYKVMSVSFALLFFVLAGFKDVFLWMSGSVNYLWTGTALLFFHHALERDTVPSWSLVPLTLFSLACGWSNEAFVIGLSAAYFIYYVILHRERLTGHRRWMLAAFFIGVALLVFAPGSLNKAAATGKPSSLFVSLYYMRHIRIALILALAVLFLAVTRRLKLREWIKREQVLLMALLVETAFLMMIGLDAVHSRFGIELFALILLLRLVDWNRIGNVAVTALNVVVLAFAAWLIPISQRCNEVCQHELKLARTSELVPTRNIVPYKWLHRYILDYSYLKVNDEKIYGYDPFLTRHFGHHVLFLPQDFVNDLSKNPSKYEGQWRSWGKLPFYAMRAGDNTAFQVAVLTYAPPTKYDRLPGFLSRLCNRIEGLKTEEREDKLLTATIKGVDYVFVPRFYPEQDDRLQSIRLE